MLVVNDARVALLRHVSVLSSVAVVKDDPLVTDNRLLVISDDVTPAPASHDLLIDSSLGVIGWTSGLCVICAVVTVAAAW